MHATVNENINGAPKMRNNYGGIEMFKSLLVHIVITLDLFFFIALSSVITLPIIAMAIVFSYFNLRGDRKKFLFAIAFMSEEERL